MSARALNQPRPARVRCSDGRPAEVDGERMDSLRESWLVEDRRWPAQPLRRRNWEAVSASGRNVVVFHDLEGAGRPGAPGGWFTQGG